MSEAPRVGYGAALRSREFRALFTGQALVVGGGSVAAVALTILVYRRTGSPFVASLTFALGFLPYLVGGTLLAGLVDRIRPRRLVAAANALGGGLAALMAVPGMPVPALLALLFCSGIVASLASGALGSLTRATVPEEAYVPGRSLMKIASQTAQIAGNPIGGALVVALGTSGAIFVDAGANMAASALVVAFVADRPNAGERSATSLVRDSLAGARAILAEPQIARLLLLGWLVPLFSVAPEALAAPYVAEHHGSASLVGWWLAALPVGVIAGDVAAVRFLRAEQQRRLVAPVAAAGFVPYLVFAFHPSIPLAVALLALSGLSGMFSLGLDARLRDATPERTFARMMALNQAGLMTLQGLGFALAGALAEAVGVSGSIVVAGGCGIAVVAVLRLGHRRGTSEAVHNLST